MARGQGRGAKSSDHSASAGPAPKLPWEALYKHIPSCETDTDGWLRMTDALCKRRFDPARPLEPSPYRDQPPSFFKSMLNPDVLHEITSARRIVCASHLALSRFATDLLARGDFEAHWCALPQSEQEELIIAAFRALAATESMGGTEMLFGPEKINCPELCRDALLGLGFVNLLKQFLLDDNNDEPLQPFILPNARYDAFIGWIEDDKSEVRKAFLGLHRMMRTRYISSFLGSLLAKYDGKEVTPVVLTTEHYKTKDALLEMKPVLKSILGSEGEKQWRAEQTAQRKGQRLHCENCFTLEDKTVSGKLMVCTKCKAIDREVRYCSRECQLEAWSSHKRQCGQPLYVSSALQDLIPRNVKRARPRPDIPPVAPGYRRTAHQLRLIEYLNLLPLKDYVLFLEEGDPRDPEVEAISLDMVQGATAFMIMRNRTLCADDADALFYVYRVLQAYERRLGNGNILRRQLEREYGATFARVATMDASGELPRLDPISREEVDAAIMHLKELGRFKVILRTYEPGKGKSIRMPIMVGPRKDVTIMADFPADLLVATLKSLSLGP